MSFQKILSSPTDIIFASRNPMEVARALADLLLANRREDKPLFREVNQMPPFAFRFPEKFDVRTPPKISCSGSFEEAFRTSLAENRRPTWDASDLVRLMHETEQRYGPAAALALTLLIAGGVENREDIIQNGIRLDRLVRKIERSTGFPAGPKSRYDWELVRAIKEQLWFLKPDRSIPPGRGDNYRLDEMLTAYEEQKLGQGRWDCIGLTILDSVILMHFGVAVQFAAIPSHVFTVLPDGAPIENTLPDLDQAREVMHGRVSSGNTYNCVGLIAIVLNSRGNHAAYERRKDEARRAYEAAAEILPNYATIWHNMGNYLSMFGSPRETIEKYSLALLFEPGEPIFHLSRSRALVQYRAWRAARLDVEAMIRLAPRDPDILSEAAGFYGWKEYWDLAMKYIKQAIAIQPDNPYFYRKRAYIWSMLGNQDGAVRDRERAMELEKGNGN